MNDRKRLGADVPFRALRKELSVSFYVQVDSSPQRLSRDTLRCSFCILHRTASVLTILSLHRPTVFTSVRSEDLAGFLRIRWLVSPEYARLPYFQESGDCNESRRFSVATAISGRAEELPWTTGRHFLDLEIGDTIVWRGVLVLLVCSTPVMGRNQDAEWLKWKEKDSHKILKKLTKSGTKYTDSRSVDLRSGHSYPYRGTLARLPFRSSESVAPTSTTAAGQRKSKKQPFLQLCLDSMSPSRVHKGVERAEVSRWKSHYQILNSSWKVLGSAQSGEPCSLELVG